MALLATTAVGALCFLTSLFESKAVYLWLLNLSGMALAGWATLLTQQVVWTRVSAHRARLVERLRRPRPSPRS